MSKALWGFIEETWKILAVKELTSFELELNFLKLALKEKLICQADRYLEMWRHATLGRKDGAGVWTEDNI